MFLYRQSEYERDTVIRKKKKRRKTSGGFDPPIQHQPYGYSTANRIPAVGRNKIDLLQIHLHPRTFLVRKKKRVGEFTVHLRAGSRLGEHGKTLLARDTFI